MPRAHSTTLWWAFAFAATAATALVFGIIVAPADAVQGGIQRLMYLHVPAAWCAYLCFLFVFVTSAWYLRTRSPGANRVAQASAEVGVALTALTLITGSVWGASTWGTWWVWDARVTTTTVMGLVYLGYLAVRGFAIGRRGQTIAAVIGVCGFALVPLVHFSVLIWRTLHQPPTILAPSLSPPIDYLMGIALVAALVAFTVLTMWMLTVRVGSLRTAAERTRVEASVPAEETPVSAPTGRDNGAGG